MAGFSTGISLRIGVSGKEDRADRGTAAGLVLEVVVPKLDVSLTSVHCRIEAAIDEPSGCTMFCCSPSEPYSRLNAAVLPERFPSWPGFVRTTHASTCAACGGPDKPGHDE
jgi:hypothetical protein